MYGEHVLNRSVRAKHFLIHEDGMVKLSGLRSVAPMIEEGSRLKVSSCSLELYKYNMRTLVSN